MEKIIISEKEKSLRLDKFLLTQLTDYSRAFLQKLIKEGSILINGEVKKQSYILKIGDIVEINLPEKEIISLESDNSIKFGVLYEDENVIVVDKPAGLSVHPSEHEKSGTLVNGLLARYPEIKDVGEDRMRPGIVHRLDKDTSGAMIVARNDRAFQFLKKQFQERHAVKKYIALVSGDIKREKGVIDLPLARRKSQPTKQVAVRAERQARGKIRIAVTEYKTLRHLIIEGREFTLVEAFPKTGRLHQIRVHFAAIGYPLAGDLKYGPKNKVSIAGLNRHFLHATSLEIDIPVFKNGTEARKMVFESALPKDLSELIE